MVQYETGVATQLTTEVAIHKGWRTIMEQYCLCTALICGLSKLPAFVANTSVIVPYVKVHGTLLRCFSVKCRHAVLINS